MNYRHLKVVDIFTPIPRQQTSLIQNYCRCKTSALLKFLVATFSKVAITLLVNLFMNRVIRYYAICATILKVKFSVVWLSPLGMQLPRTSIMHLHLQ